VIKILYGSQSNPFSIKVSQYRGKNFEKRDEAFFSSFYAHKEFRQFKSPVPENRKANDLLKKALSKTEGESNGRRIRRAKKKERLDRKICKHYPVPEGDAESRVNPAALLP
jgi:hypothetical protein